MRRQWLGWNYALLVIGLVVLAMLVIDFNSRMAGLRRLSLQNDKVAAQLESLEQTRAYLDTQIALGTSEAAVYEWAYQDGRWIREGDVPIVPLPQPGEASQPTVLTVPTPQPESNWKIWLLLFFDNLPVARGAP